MIIRFYFVLIIALCFPYLAKAQTLVISEFMADNSTTLVDEDGAFSDWIEIRNTSASAIDLTGWHLSDDETNTNKWTFPSEVLASNSFLIVWASGKDKRVSGQNLHTNFGLSQDGEYLGIFRPDETLEFEWTPNYPSQFEDISFGLPNNNVDPPGVYFSSPSPGSLNGAGDPSVGIPAPSFSIERGLFSAQFNLQILPESGTMVRYTLDSSKPSSSIGIIYTGAINISQTTVVRAIGYNANGSSKVVTHSYLFLDDVVGLTSTPSGYPGTWQSVTNGIGDISADYWMDTNLGNWGGASIIEDSIKDLPIMSLNLPVDSIFGQSGWYNNGGKDNNDPYEKETSIELIYPDGSQGFQVDGGVQGRSHAADRNRKRGITVEFKKKYGPGKLDFDIFKDAPLNRTGRATKFDKLMLRSGMLDTYTGFGAQNLATLTRDGVLRDAQIAISGYGVHHDYVQLFINKMYWGVYGIAERVDQTFAADYFGGQEEDYMVVKRNNDGDDVGLDEIDGPRAQYDELISLLESSSDNFANSATYQQAQQYVDAFEFASYIIIAGYHRVGDWPIRNWFFVSRATPREPGRFVAWDSELTWQDGGPWYPSPLYNSSSQGYNTLPARLWRAMTKNADFRMLFQDRAYQLMYNGGGLEADSSIARWDAHTNRISEAIKAEQARWGDTKSPTENHAEWVGNINATRNLLPNVVADFENAFDDVRNGVLVINAMNPPSFSQLGGAVPAGFQLAMSNSPNGNSGAIIYTLDGSDPRGSGGSIDGTNGGDTENVPISGTVTVNARVRLDNATWSAMQSATFYAPQNLTDLVINEIHYHPLDEGSVGLPGFVDGDEFEFIELKNVGSNAIQAQDLSFSGGINYSFVSNSTISAGGFFVLAENEVEFENRYGFAPNGTYSDKLSNSGEQIVLQDFAGTVIDSLTYGDSSPWFSLPDGNGPSLSLDPTQGTNNSSPSDWLPSRDTHGTPGAENVVNVPPVVLFTSPSQNQRFDPGDTINILVAASDVNDSVDSVRVQTGSLSIGTDESSPYSFSWQTPPGDYKLVAKAWDSFQARGVSDTLVIFVRELNPCDNVPDLVINEINYNDNDIDGPITGDWIELYNPNANPVNLDGWVFKDSQDENWMVLPNASIVSKGHHVLVQNDALFSSVHSITNKSAEFSWGLDGTGDGVRIYSPSGCLIDTVVYDDALPWPEEADGLGASLELKDPILDNTLASSWEASLTNGGSPGVANSGVRIDARLLSPANTTGIESGGNTTVTAIIESIPNLTRAELLIDALNVGSLIQDPINPDLYDFDLVNYPDGLYELQIVAENSAGQISTSAVSIFCIGEVGDGAFVESGGQLVFEAEDFQSNIARDTDSWVSNTMNLGFSGLSYMLTVPDDGTKVTTGYAGTVSELQYQMRINSPGVYYVIYRGWADDGTNNSVHFGLNGAEDASLQDIGLGSAAYGSWTWASTIDDGSRATIDISSPGIHTLNLWMREDGTNVDRVILTQDPNYLPTDAGPSSSARELQKIRLTAKMILGGAWNTNSMRTDLQAANYIPSSQPYSDLPSKSIDSVLLQNMTDVVDWVRLELRSGLGSASTVYAAAYLLRSDGQIIDTNGSPELGLGGVADGEYYVVLGHRNHLSVMSANAFNFTSDLVVDLDVTSSLGAAYAGTGVPMTQIGSVFALWPGDASADGQVIFTGGNNDRVLVLSSAGGPTVFDTTPGYLDADLSLDGIVKYSGSNNDRVIILNTAGGPSAFDRRQSQVPD